MITIERRGFFGKENNIHMKSIQNVSTFEMVLIYLFSTGQLHINYILIKNTTSALVKYLYFH